MERLRLIPLDDTVVFPNMTVTLGVDVGEESRVLLVPKHVEAYAKGGVIADVVDRVRMRGRVSAVVRQLAERSGVPVSIDTSKAAVAIEAIAGGAEIINDVTGLAGDPDMLRVAVTSGTGVCAMHMQGTPQTMQVEPRYDDVVADIHRYLAARRDALLQAGIPREKICLDPGIGFGNSWPRQAGFSISVCRSSSATRGRASSARRSRLRSAGRPRGTNSTPAPPARPAGSRGRGSRSSASMPWGSCGRRWNSLLRCSGKTG